MQTIRTHNAFHLGDNLVHLHFLRKVALANPDRQFIHAAGWQYRRQIEPVVVDIPNIKITEIEHDTFYRYPFDGSREFHHAASQPNPDYPKNWDHNRSINSWRGANGFWYKSEIRNDFIEFHLKEWFPYLCERMEVENPMRDPSDMLFDYPAIKTPIHNLVPFDVLVINSPPASGQFHDFNASKLEQIIYRLEYNDFHVVTSGSGLAKPYFTATQIGHLSLHCHTILMVSTGPSWPTFNVWNRDSIKHRIILLDNERVNLSANTMHCEKIEEAEEVLKHAGLL